MITFHENWFPQPKRDALMTAMRSVEAPVGDVIEVGSWEGKSTIDIANFFYPLNVTAIDHWKGDLNYTENGLADLAASRDVFATFQNNISLGTRGNVVVARMDWRDYVWDQPIRFIFIDGEHTYDQVRDNIEIVKPLMVPGGIICGDDLAHPPVAQAVFDSLGQVIGQYVSGADVWFTRWPR